MVDPMLIASLVSYAGVITFMLLSDRLYLMSQKLRDRSYSGVIMDAAPIVQEMTNYGL